jgi:sugar phosphate isomerase/epimerase
MSEAFSQVGTKIALEFMPFSNISTLTRALELVQTADHPAGGLMVDLWHLMRGAGTLDELAKVPLHFIAGVELDDGDAEQVGDGYSDTVLRRRLCGEGSFPVAEAIRVLRGLGWNGPWGVEILSEVYRVRPLDEAVPDAFASTMTCFAEAGAEVD